MKDRNKVTPAAYLILRKKHDVFLTRRAHTGYFNGYYSLPAGHVEANELPTTAIIREAREEVGVIIKKKDVHFFHALYRQAVDDTGDRVDYFFISEKFKNEPKNCEPQKCDDARWFPLKKLPSKITPEVKWVLKLISKKISYSEMPFDKKNINPEAKN